MNTAKDANIFDPQDKVNALVCFLMANSPMNEEWRELPIGHGFYFVSNTGRVLSLYNHVPRVLKQYRCNDYNYVSINGKDRRINRLVAKAFIPNPEHKKYVHHLDNNKLNNHVNNLQWATPSENTLEYYRAKQEEKERAKEEIEQ